MLEFMIQLIPTAIVLGVLIFFHELGHFLACRFAGVGVEKFSIGFGPELFHWNSKRTRYALSLIPFGGFVKPQGESQEEVDKRGQLQAGDFLAAKPLHRFIILVAGVTMNFLLAYFLFFGVMMTGRPVPAPEIGGFSDWSPAKTAGVQVGDFVQKINGARVGSFQDLKVRILENGNAPMTLDIKRGDEELSVKVTPEMKPGIDLFGAETDVPLIGIASGSAVHTERYPFAEALYRAAELEWRLIVMTYQALWKLATGSLSPKTLVGPIGIVSMTGTAAQLGIGTLVQFTALLSVSLGVINLLPIPALDGGHVLFLGIEVLRRKPVSVKVQERITQYGFYFLILLMIVVVFNDLANLGVIDKVKGLFQ